MNPTEAEKLYHAINKLMIKIGADGEVDTRTPEVQDVMALLQEIDGGVYEPN